MSSVSLEEIRRIGIGSGYYKVVGVLERNAGRLLKQFSDDRDKAINRVMLWIYGEEAKFPDIEKESTENITSVSAKFYNQMRYNPNLDTFLSRKSCTDYRDKNGNLVIREWVEDDEYSYRRERPVHEGRREERTHYLMLHYPDGTRAAKITMGYSLTHSKSIRYEMPEDAYVKEIEYYYPRKEINITTDRSRAESKKAKCNGDDYSHGPISRVVTAGEIAKKEFFSAPSFFAAANDLDSRFNEREVRLGSGLNITEKKVKHKSGEVEWERTEDFARGRGIEVRARKIIEKHERNRRSSGKAEESPSQVKRLVMQELDDSHANVCSSRISV